MNRLLLFGVVAAVLAATVALSRQAPAENAPTDSGPFRVATGEKNPWTHLKPPASNDQFQFAIVSDRTGGHRANVFAKAVQQLNLLQPEFVMSVGDLVEGYKTNEEAIAKEWDEFDAYAKKLEMPFFYVPGNHDMANTKLVDFWGGRFGKSYYHFTYKSTLFLSVNSEDGKSSKVSERQIEAIKKALDENTGVNWTMIFVHKPLWAEKDLEANGWAAVEKLLEGRKYTVFCGHVHRYQKYVRNGMNYYQLATTGGGSKLRGPEYGEFDHLVWITMKPDGPLIANILMDGILPENLQLPAVSEPGTVVKKQPLVPVTGTVTMDGKPVAGVTVTFVQQDAPTGFRNVSADCLTGPNGEFKLSSYERFDGAPAGKYKVTVVKTGRGYYDGEHAAKSQLPEKYAKGATTPLTAEVRAGGPNTIDLAIESK